MKKRYWLKITILIVVITILCLAIYSRQRDKENNDNSFFSTNAVHSLQPGGWGAGYPEMYYFADNGTYYWDIGGYSETEKIVATKGTWKIKDGFLILNESQQLYRDSYEIVESLGGGGGYDLANYKIKVKEVNNTYRLPIKYSEKIDFYGDGSRYFEEYLMADEIWYCPVGIDFEELGWVNELINYNSSSGEIIYNKGEFIYNEIDGSRDFIKDN